MKSDSIKSQSSNLTINVDDLGLLLVNVKADATIDFNKVSSVMVSYRYEDADQKIQRIERSFVLDNTTKTYNIQEVLGVPRTKPYQYQVEYRMKSGQRFLKTWQSSESPQLFIGSPFSETKTYKMMGRGYSTIQEMFVDLKYEEEGNNYRQTRSVALKQGVTPDAWEVPVIDPKKGKLTYTGTIMKKDGTTEEIPTTEHSVDKTVIVVGKPDIEAEKLSVTVYPDLIKWDDKLRLVQVNLKYEDTANKVSAEKTLNFKSNVTQAVKWEVDIKDKTKKTFQWKATFHSDPPYSTGWQSTTDTDVYPESPAAAAPQVQAGKLTVTVYPDLIEWDNKLKLVQVNLKYEDTANNVSAEKTLNFKKETTEAVKWEVELKDKTKKTFQWKATFRSDQVRSDGWQSTTDTDVYIENPAKGATA
jgi:ribosome-associated translation inhibitor RaiA